MSQQQHDWNRPAFCRNCGRPYPWTEQALQAAKELAAESLMSDEDLGTFGQSIDELTRETPRTQLAIVRFKKIMDKAGPVVTDGVKSILTSVLSEAVKKQLWG
jgi:hypothetical protein